jgi:hypothetical protein
MVLKIQLRKLILRMTFVMPGEPASAIDDWRGDELVLGEIGREFQSRPHA